MKKFSNTKGILHAKMGTIKDKQNILRRVGKNTQKSNTTDHDPDNNDGVILT